MADRPPPKKKKINIGGDVSPAVLTPEDGIGMGPREEAQYMYNWLAYDRQ